MSEHMRRDMQVDVCNIYGSYGGLTGQIRQYHFGLQRMEHMDPDRKAYWICILLIWIGRLRL